MSMVVRALVHHMSLQLLHIEYTGTTHDICHLCFLGGKRVRVRVGEERLGLGGRGFVVVEIGGWGTIVGVVIVVIVVE